MLILVHKFAVAGSTAKMMTKPFIMAGTIAWVAIMLIVITSIPQMRNAWYGVFKVSLQTIDGVVELTARSATSPG